MRSTHTSCVRKRFCPNCARAFKLNKNGTSKCLDNHLRTCQPCDSTIDEVATEFKAAGPSCAVRVGNPEMAPKEIVSEIRLTKYNAHKYVGHRVKYKSRGVDKEHHILKVSISGKSIKIDNEGDLESFLQIVSRRVYVNVRHPDEAKARYEAMAAADKLRYQTEMESYAPSTAVTPKKIKPVKPMLSSNAWMCYSKARWCAVRVGNPEMSSKEIVSALSKMWKGLDEEAKAPYKAMAAADKLRYQTEWESYFPEFRAWVEGGCGRSSKKLKKVKKTNSPIGPIKKSSCVGVHWHRGAKKWRACCKGTYLGIFENEVDAVTEVTDYMAL